MTVTTTPDAPAAVTPAAPASPAPSKTSLEITSARQRLAEGQSLLPGEAPTPAPAASAKETGPAAMTITLPGMEERGEQPLELEAPDQETHERLQRLQNEATIGREVKAEQRGVADLRRQLAEVEDKIGGDPTGFVLEQMPDATRAEIAMQMFFEAGVLEAIQERLAQGENGRTLIDIIEDPEALRTLRAELKASRLEMRDTLHQRRQVETAMRTNANAIIAEIDHLVPKHFPDEQRARVVQDAVRDISDRCRRLGLTELDVRDVAPIIEQRVRSLGAVTARRSSAPAAAPSRPARPAALGGEMPTGTKARIELAKKIGLKALLDRARGT